MIGRVAANPIDAFGVVVEGSSGVHEHQNRSFALMGGSEVVDGLDRVARTRPVRGGVELPADHHRRRQLRRWVTREPLGGRYTSSPRCLKCEAPAGITTGTTP